MIPTPYLSEWITTLKRINKWIFTTLYGCTIEKRSFASEQLTSRWFWETTCIHCIVVIKTKPLATRGNCQVGLRITWRPVQYRLRPNWDEFNTIDNRKLRWTPAPTIRPFNKKKTFIKENKSFESVHSFNTVLRNIWMWIKLQE